MKKTSYIILFLFFSAYSKAPTKSIRPANIIFDLHGVLFETSTISFTWLAGPLHFIGGFNPLTIEHTFYNYLDHIKPRLATTPLIYQKNKFLLPQIMCEWLDGSITPEELLSLINDYLKKISPSIDSKRKIKLIRALASCMFDPQKFAKTIRPIKQGKKLLKKCFNQTDGHGNQQHTIFIASNWDPSSYPLLLTVRKLGRILSYARDSFISGFTHLLKPDPLFFECAFKQFGIDPDTELTIYIDDEECNIQAAQDLHKKQLHCIHCKNKNFKKIKKELKKLGVLP